jgi:hypothetical protein
MSTAATETRTAADLFARFAPALERVRLAQPFRNTCRGTGWRTPYKDACEVLQSAADDLGFGDDFDQVAAAVAAKLAEIEARAPQG